MNGSNVSHKGYFVLPFPLNHYFKKLNKFSRYNDYTTAPLFLRHLQSLFWYISNSQDTAKYLESMNNHIIPGEKLAVFQLKQPLLPFFLDQLLKAFKKDSDDIFFRGTIIAIFTTIPSISSFFIAWYMGNDLILAAIIATIVHVISMAISFKISKKLFLKK